MKERFHICLYLNHDPNWHGGTIYIQNVVKALHALPHQERSQLFISILASKAGMPFANEVASLVDAIYPQTFVSLAFNKAFQYLNRFLGPLAKPFRRWMNYRRIDFFYPAVRAHGAPFPWGGWIQDFQYKHLPQFFTAEQIKAYQHRFDQVAEFADTVAFSSYHAASDFNAFYPGMEYKAHVLRFVNRFNLTVLNQNPTEIQRKYDLPDQFFLVCNQFWKHKDHGTILKALALLKAEGIEPVVALTGATEDFRNPAYYPELQNEVSKLGLDAQWRVLGFISRDDQMQLMRRCMGVIQPSLFEGWSTVVEDARCLGKPMLLSDFPVHVEQDPPGALFFPMGNARQLAEAWKQALQLWQPGPDAEKEKAALADNEQKLVAFGRSMVEMAQKAQRNFLTR